MNEEWRSISSRPRFEASSLGRVREISTRRILAVQTRADGYQTVYIDRAPRYLHRLVCEAFHGPAPEGFVAAHGDGARARNVPSNLRWASYAENEADKLRHGTKAQGSRSGTSKLTEAEVISIRSAYRLGLGTQAAIGAAFGVAQTKISDIVNYKTWKHVA